jgi:hypothetical protein
VLPVRGSGVDANHVVSPYYAGKDKTACLSHEFIVSRDFPLCREKIKKTLKQWTFGENRANRRPISSKDVTPKMSLLTDQWVDFSPCRAIAPTLQ